MGCPILDTQGMNMFESGSIASGTLAACPAHSPIVGTSVSFVAVCCLHLPWLLPGACGQGPMRHVVALLALLVAAAPATASLIEDTLAPTGVTYQEDGGVHGDAPGTCEEAVAAHAVEFGTDEPVNMLVEVDDEADAFVFNLTTSQVGERVALSLVTHLLTDRYDVAFDVLSPDCSSSVFDPNSTYYDRPPSDPYPLPPNGAGYEATLTGYACDANQWKFLANQMGGIPAPDTIYVEWTDGSYEYVAVDKSTPATVAMYLTSDHLDVTVARAVIVLPSTWHGQFKIASGPCDAVPGTAVEDPYLNDDVTPTYGEFTVQEEGTHVILVHIVRGTVDKTQGTVNDLLADPPTQLDATCHRDTCSLALAYASYDLGTDYAA